MPEVDLRKIHHSLMPKIKQDVFGPSSQIFVGSQNYPNLSVGPLVSLGEQPLSPVELYSFDYTSIVEKSANLVRGKKSSYVTQRIEDKMKDVSLSVKSIDVEMLLKKPPNISFEFSHYTNPMAASGTIERYDLAGNPKIPGKVDSIIEDNLKAADAIAELSEYGLNNYYLMNALSIGVLGKRENQKLVPTRWSITATDDTIGKQMMELVRDYQELNNILFFENKFLHNNYNILILPGRWEFENFESWEKGSSWNSSDKEYAVSEEYEPHLGRTTYATEQVGGYYASRYSILEYLNSIRRQGRVVVFREIDRDYNIPVGVWQVREGVKHAFDKKPLIIESLNSAFKFLGAKLKIPIKRYQSLSRILRQTRILDF